MNIAKLFGLLFVFILSSHTVIAQSAPVQTRSERIAALKLEIKNTEDKVKAIVNQPVASYPINTWVDLYVSSPGWFHPGAVTPDYSKDVRTTREMPYEKHEYVTSDVSPGVMYKGKDVEFNAMLKYYYTDRNVPKKKLTDAEMNEINRLYRIIGRDQKAIADMESYSWYFSGDGIGEFFNSLYGTIAELMALVVVGGLAYRKLFKQRY